MPLARANSILVRVMDWWPSYITLNSVTVSSELTSNVLFPSDTIWRHKSGSTLAQVMACCLTAPIHYINQCWLINKVQWHSSQCNFTRDASAISHWNYLENHLSKFLFKSPWDQWLNTYHSVFEKVHRHCGHAHHHRQFKRPRSVDPW